MGKTIIISNRLPVKILQWKEGFEFTSSEGGLATGLGSIYRQENNIWLGWPGIEILEGQQQQEVKDKLAELSLMPVFLTQNEINLYYEGFSNEILWPIFHYFPSYAHYVDSYWHAYKKVNKKFKEAVLQIIEEDDIIWIHDYQLLLLPGLIRQEMPDVTIGFFQHIPFPSLEIFRLIPWRVEILEGILGADLVGFHTYDDVRHFISSASRLLPVQTSSNIITINERPVVAESFPMGIDSKKFEDATHTKVVMDQIETLKKNFSHVSLILSVDRLDYSKGILQRLKAIHSLFDKNPKYLEKVVFYMIVVPSRDTVPQYKDLKDEIDKVVGNINAYYRTLDWIPIHYYYRSFTSEALSALYSIANICLVTPMRDGMNLVCKEYVASRTNNNGVLILSEMAGAAKELVDAIIVNPNNIGEIYRAIIQAITMPEQEQQRRMKQMREVVDKFNIRHWVKIYMNGLKEAKQFRESMQAKWVGSGIKQQIEEKYMHSKRRIIFLDYDGTLVAFNTNINLASPDKDLLGMLKNCCADPANKLVLVSGRNHETLEDWFRHLPLDIIAEHGAWQKKYDEEWYKIPGLTDAWKQDIFPVLERFTDRTPGSFIEVKSYSLVWHYRKVERGLGELRANELSSDLRYFIADKGLQLLLGNKIIEIKNVEVNKGKAALNWLEEQDYDYIMALGDDHTDEDIFRALPEDAITIKISSNVSAAKYYLRNFIEARQLLKSLFLKGSTIST